MKQIVKSTKALFNRLTAGTRKANVSDCKICPDCDGEMQSYDVPIEKPIKIPFSEWEIVLRNWNSKAWYCYDCTRDGHQARFDDAYDAGIEDGFKRGYREAERELGKFYYH